MQTVRSISVLSQSCLSRLFFIRVSKKRTFHAKRIEFSQIMHLPGGDSKTISTKACGWFALHLLTFQVIILKMQAWRKLIFLSVTRRSGPFAARANGSLQWTARQRIHGCTLIPMRCFSASLLICSGTSSANHPVAKRLSGCLCLPRGIHQRASLGEAGADAQGRAVPDLTKRPRRHRKPPPC